MTPTAATRALCRVATIVMFVAFLPAAGSYVLGIQGEVAEAGFSRLETRREPALKNLIRCAQY